MAYYEAVFIARQDMSPAQVDELTQQLSKIIEAAKGKVVSKENWGLRTLAYPIKKNKKGHYILLNLDTPSEAIKEFERKMRLNEDVLRFLTIRLKELNKKPSPMMAEGR